MVGKLEWVCEGIEILPASFRKRPCRIGIRLAYSVGRIQRYSPVDWPQRRSSQEYPAQQMAQPESGLIHA